MSDRLTQLLKLHKADPKDPFLTYGIALEHAKADRLEEAIPWLDRTIEQDAGYCYAYFQKGRILSELGQTQQATQVLEQGLQVAAAKGDEKARSEIAELLQSLDE